MSDKFVRSLTEQYNGLVKSIEDVQATAVAENRGLTDDEFRSAKESGDKAKKLAEQITDAVEQASRSAAVGKMAAGLTDEDGYEPGELDHDADDNPDGTDKTTGQRSKAPARTAQRDPGHYRSVAERGNRSFFADLYNAGKKIPDVTAVKRLAEHSQFMRAAGPVTQAGGGLGIVPPKWLTSEYLKMGRQGRVVAKLVRSIPLGDDPRALVLPKQTAQVDADMTTQTAEGTNNTGWGDPLFATNEDTLTPTAQAAYQDVSRQLLAAGTPAADVLIMDDLHDAWDLKAEKLVCTTILAGGTASATFATDYSVAAGTATNTQFNYVGGAGAGSAAINAVIDAQTAAANALYGPADIAIMNYSRFGKFRKLVDSTGRSLMPVTKYGPQNAAGGLTNVLVGDIEGVDAYATNGVPGTGVPSAEKLAILRSQTVLFAESDVLEFNYEQVVGPSSVRMGVFGYMGAFARVAAAIQIITVTAA